MLPQSFGWWTNFRISMSFEPCCISAFARYWRVYSNRVIWEKPRLECAREGDLNSASPSRAHFKQRHFNFHALHFFI